MGSARSVAQFTNNINSLSQRIAAPSNRATLEAARLFGELVDRDADRAGATSWADRRRPPYRTRLTKNGVAVIRPGNVGATVALNEGTKQHIIGARGLGTRRAFQRNQQAIGANAAFGGTNRFRPRSSGKRALSWAGGRHPTPYAFVSGTRGFGFIKTAKKHAPEKAAEQYMRVKRSEITRGGR